MVSQSKPGQRPGFFLPVFCAALLAVAGCDAPVTEAPALPKARPAKLVVAGRLEDKNIREASGMAWSARSDKLLWLLNDGGNKPRLYAIDLAGRTRGLIKLDGVKNRDWEDLASFRLDGDPYLLVADIGDNDSSHEHVRLYAVPEPDLDTDDEPSVTPAWIVKFRYPDGPRDAEAIAVDSENNRVLVVTKRDLPAIIFSVPLQPGSDAVLDAERIGALTSIPQPREEDIRFAPVSKDWHWQPTAMDIAADGSALIVLTYGAIYYFDRQPGVDWPERLAQGPLAFDLKDIRDAEAAALSNNGEQIFISVERKHAPLLRIDIGPTR